MWSTTCYVFECSTVLYRLYLLTIKSTQPAASTPSTQPSHHHPPPHSMARKVHLEISWCREIWWLWAQSKEECLLHSVVWAFPAIWWPSIKIWTHFCNSMPLASGPPMDIAIVQCILWIVRSQFDTKTACVLNI